MRLAASNDVQENKERGIRDTSATDIAVAPASPRKRIVWIAAAILALIIGLLLLLPLWQRWSQAEVSVPLERVRTATVTRGDFVRDVGVQGTVVAAVSPTVFAVAEGTVTLNIQAGDAVKEGEVLAEIDSPDLTSQLEQEQSSLQSAQTEFERQKIEFKRRQFENQQTIDLALVRFTAAERELRRAQAAHDANAISLQDFEKANDDVDTARLEIEHARQNGALEKEVMDFELQTKELTVDRQKLLVANLQRRVNELQVTSPVTGMIGNLAVEQKATVLKNQPLLTVVDLSAFEVEMQVPESYGDTLSLGLPAEISYSGRNYPGLVTAISPEVRNNQVTGRVRFADQPPAGLRQNQRVSVRVILESSEDVLMVQRGPFLDSDGGQVAYVLANGIAERRQIRVGASSINSVQIVDGLREGDTIITSSLSQFDGANTVYVTD
jgi:HlyD family secretion protein